MPDDEQPNTLTIGALAVVTGATRDTINSWMGRGLLPMKPPGRGRARRYSAEDATMLAVMVVLTRNAVSAGAAARAIAEMGARLRTADFVAFQGGSGQTMTFSGHQAIDDVFVALEEAAGGWTSDPASAEAPRAPTMLHVLNLAAIRARVLAAMDVAIRSTETLPNDDNMTTAERGRRRVASRIRAHAQDD